MATRVLAEIGSSSIYYKYAKEAFGEAGVEVDFGPSKTEEERRGKLKDYEILIPAGDKKLGKELIDAATKLRMIQVNGIGFDYIDVKAAAQKQITVCNTGGFIAQAVAEHAWALLLDVTKKVTISHMRMTAGEDLIKDGWWSPPVAVEIYGKTMGLVGMGNIGRRIARIARAFDMKILAYDPYIGEDVAQMHSARLVGLNQVMKESDFVCVSVPLNDETRGLVGEKEIALLKPTAYLVNICRGPVLQESALVNALKAGKIAGAGLDVFEKEPLSRDSALRRMQNVVLTPHSASNTDEASVQLFKVMAMNVKRFIDGKRPFWKVN